MRKAAWVVVAVTFLCGRLLAQENVPLPQIGLDFNFNHTDVMLGAHAGIAVPKINASFAATFQGRIGSKRVLIEGEQPYVFYQYRERRYLLGVEADKRFLLREFNESTHFGAFLGGFGGLGFGDYRGTKQSAPVGLAYSAMGGVYITEPKTVIIKLGYQYLPMHTQNVFDHRILLTFSFLIS